MRSRNCRQWRLNGPAPLLRLAALRSMPLRISAIRRQTASAPPNGRRRGLWFASPRLAMWPSGPCCSPPCALGRAPVGCVCSPASYRVYRGLPGAPGRGATGINVRRKKPAVLHFAALKRAISAKKIPLNRGKSLPIWPGCAIIKVPTNIIPTLPERRPAVSERQVHMNHTTKCTGLQVAHLQESKLQSQQLAYILYLQSLELQGQEAAQAAARAARTAACSEYWQGYQCPVCGRLHNMITYGCKHRLCPVCAVRKSRAVAAQAMQVVDQIARVAAERHETYDFCLLTLTQRNVEAEFLSAEIDHMLEAWSSIRYLRQVRRDLVGWARTIEITVNESDGSFHPHIHCILIVRHGSALASADTWRKLWADAMRLDYIPICDCRPIESLGAVYEVSKYVSKLGRILDMPLGRAYDAISAIGEATHWRRLRSYGGIWSKIRRQLHMQEVDLMDDGTLDAVGALIDSRCKCHCGADLEPVALMWAGMDYKKI